EKRLGNDEAEDAVTEEFEPLVVADATDGGMGERLDEERRVGEFVAKPLCRLRHGPREFHSIASKNRSARHVQKASIDGPAEEKITRSARPTSRSNGTMPTPPALRGK